MCLFFLFLGIAFLVGKSQPTQAVRLAACVCFLLLIKYCFPVEGFSRRFFQFFLGGYVLSTTAGLMAVVGLWEPSDFFLLGVPDAPVRRAVNATALGNLLRRPRELALDELVAPEKSMRALGRSVVPLRLQLVCHGADADPLGLGSGSLGAGGLADLVVKRRQRRPRKDRFVLAVAATRSCSAILLGSLSGPGRTIWQRPGRGRDAVEEFGRGGRRASSPTPERRCRVVEAEPGSDGAEGWPEDRAARRRD